MTRAIVVVPTYNERRTLPEVIARTMQAPVPLDVLVVDDASPDGTGEIAEQLAHGSDRIAVLHRPRKDGLGPAYRDGLGWALERGYDVLVEMDADLSHDPGQLPELVAATATNDLVIGSRYVPGGEIRNWPWHRRLLSAGGNHYVRLATGVPVRDATSGFRAFRRPVLEEIGLGGLTSDGYAFQLETVLRAWRAGFAVSEVPITFVERRAGASKISRRIIFEALLRVLAWAVTGPRGPIRQHPRSVLTGDGDTAAPGLR